MKPKRCVALSDILLKSILLFHLHSPCFTAVAAFKPGSSGSVYAKCHGQEVQCDVDFRGVAGGTYSVTWKKGPAVCFLNDKVEKLATSKSPHSTSKEKGVDMILRCT